jgi:hypothetical protein
LLFLTILVLLLAASDGLITYKVLSRHGVEVELNKLIVAFASACSLGWAVSLGIALPTMCWLLIAYLLHAPLILALLVAARAGFLVKQIETHRPLKPRPEKL